MKCDADKGCHRASRVGQGSEKTRRNYGNHIKKGLYRDRIRFDRGLTSLPNRMSEKTTPSLCPPAFSLTSNGDILQEVDRKFKFLRNSSSSLKDPCRKRWDSLPRHNLHHTQPDRVTLPRTQGQTTIYAVESNLNGVLAGRPVGG